MTVLQIVGLLAGLSALFVISPWLLMFWPGWEVFR